jgi:hypothetical protein
MNIWALDKDTSIKHLLLLLEQDIGIEGITFLDIEQLHYKSIRIGSKDSQETAYIYSYGQHDQHYGLHLEYPFNREANVSELEDMYEDLSYDGLLEMLKVHFQWLTEKG